jgi:Ca-activated chloride channel homolog
VSAGEASLTALAGRQSRKMRSSLVSLPRWGNGILATWHPSGAGSLSLNFNNLSLVRQFTELIMRSAFKFLISAAVLVTAIQHAEGQAAKPSPTPDTQSSLVFINEVRVPVIVEGKDKQPVLGLTKDDFVVFEDKQQQQIVSFRDENDNPPVYVAVLMDTSPSTAGKIKFEQEAAKNFIFTITRLRKDKVAFVTFDDQINLRQDFTDKLDKLSTAVDAVKKPGNQTALFDAVYQVCDEKMRSAPGLRVLVVITDGEDTYSRAELKDAIDIAQRTETTVFVISTKAGFLGTVPGVDAGTVNDKGDKELTRLAEDTGGNVFFTGDMLALEKSFTRIAKQLRTAYILTYKPQRQEYDGTERSIEVRLVRSGKDYKLRARKGYTAIKPR